MRQAQRPSRGRRLFSWQERRATKSASLPRLVGRHALSVALRGSRFCLRVRNFLCRRPARLCPAYPGAPARPRQDTHERHVSPTDTAWQDQPNETTMRLVACPNYRRSRLRRPHTACVSSIEPRLIFRPRPTVSSTDAASPQHTARDIARSCAMKRASISCSADNRRMALFCSAERVRGPCTRPDRTHDASAAASHHAARRSPRRRPRHSNSHPPSPRPVTTSAAKPPLRQNPGIHGPRHPGAGDRPTWRHRPPKLVLSTTRSWICLTWNLLAYRRATHPPQYTEPLPRRGPDGSNKEEV